MHLATTLSMKGAASGNRPKVCRCVDVDHEPRCQGEGDMGPWDPWDPTQCNVRGRPLVTARRLLPCDWKAGAASRPEEFLFVQDHLNRCIRRVVSQWENADTTTRVW